MAAAARETEGMRAGMAAGRVVGQFPICPSIVHNAAFLPVAQFQSARDTATAPIARAGLLPLRLAEPVSAFATEWCLAVLHSGVLQPRLQRYHFGKGRKKSRDAEPCPQKVQPRWRRALQVPDAIPDAIPGSKRGGRVYTTFGHEAKMEIQEV